MSSAGFALLALVGCFSVETEGPQPQPADPVLPDGPAEAEPEPQPDPIPDGDGEAYSDRWLIILSSKKELGHVPEGARKILSDDGDVEADLARLSSTEFKSLQPCYEIVVAGAFAGRKDALAFSRELTAKGVENYPKQAGRWVGPQPRVDDYCQGVASPSDVACPAGAALAETHAGRHFARFDLGAVVEERALEGVGTPKRITESVWEVALSAETLGAHSKGEVVEGFDLSGPPGQCEVKGFVALTRGTPHFGWFEQGDKSKPGCGGPEVWAELTCQGVDAVQFVSSSPVGRVQPGGEISPDEADAVAVQKVLGSHPGWMAFAAAADDQAEGESVEASWAWERLKLGERVVIGARGTWITGEGMAECGAGDVHEEAYALVDPASGAVLVEPVDVYGLSAVLPVDIGNDGTWELWVRDWSGSTRFLSKGEGVCESRFDYCDCPW